MNFGQKLEKLRNQLGYNYVQLGREIGLSADTLSGYEKNSSGNISIQNIKKIADYFNVSIDYLLLEENNVSTILDNYSNIVTVGDVIDIKILLEEVIYKLSKTDNVKFGDKDTNEHIKQCAIDGLDVLLSILNANINS